MKYTHQCTQRGCLAKYESDDEDAYLCPGHLEERKNIAKEIDAKFANRPLERKPSLLQQYDMAQKSRGLIRADDLLNF